MKSGYHWIIAFRLVSKTLGPDLLRLCSDCVVAGVNEGCALTRALAWPVTCAPVAQRTTGAHTAEAGVFK